jgi:hypothetical protein
MPYGGYPCYQAGLSAKEEEKPRCPEGLGKEPHLERRIAPSTGVMDVPYPMLVPGAYPNPRTIGAEG